MAGDKWEGKGTTGKNEKEGNDWKGKGGGMCERNGKRQMIVLLQAVKEI